MSIRSRTGHVYRRFLQFSVNEWGPLIVLLLIAGGIWAFVELADEVMEGETHAMDKTMILAMRNPEDRSDPIGPAWVEEMARDMTALGGIAVLTLITIAVVSFLLMQKRRRAAGYLLLAVIGGLVLSQVLKAGFDRPRPDLVPHGSHVVSASFPSGHSAMSAVVYMTLGALLARLHRRRRLKAFLIGVALFVTVLVGFSRVYLGVHWPTDVLGGWALGVGWALICWLGAWWLQRRGQVEEEPPPDDTEETVTA